MNRPQKAQPEPPVAKLKAPRLDQLLDDFETAYGLTVRPKQLSNTRNVIRHFLQDQQIDSLADLTALDVRRYLDNVAARGVSTVRLRQHECSLSVFCGFLMGRGCLTMNPCRETQWREAAKSPLPDKKLPEHDSHAKPETRLQRLVREFRTANALMGSSHQVRHNISSIERFLADQKISVPGHITPGRIAQHLAGLLNGGGLAPATVRNVQGSLSCFCQFLVGEGALKANPAQGLRRRKVEKKPPLFLDENERAQALEIAEQHGIRNEVSLALNTGLRMNELRLSKWEDVDWNRKVITVPKSKSKTFRLVPLNREALAALQDQQTKADGSMYIFPGGRPCKDGIERKGTWGQNHPRRTNWWGTEALKPLRAKIAKFSQVPKGVGRGWHLFRHSFASRMVQAGVSILKVSKWLGHAQINTTMIYAHLAEGYDADIERA